MSHAPLTPGYLESHLWEAANILRGPVDAADQERRLCVGAAGVLSVEEALQRLQESAVAASAAEERLITLLKREGLLI